MIIPSHIKYSTQTWTKIRTRGELWTRREHDELEQKQDELEGLIDELEEQRMN